MSNTQFAFLKSEHIPERATLQSWIDELGFDLQLAPDLDLRSDQGFSPCILEGVRDVGFELWPDTTEEVAEGDGDILEMAGPRGFCIAMSWGGRMKDCAAAMIVSCALAKYCDAVISYECEAPDSLGDMLEATAEILEDARSEG